ncbi:OmpA family protein [Afifella sp. H1R]|uniref:OmpA family protein n=1 Tax=Afifella sp. H1R TaxID=2908841 RepID=UPI001F2FD259|nr:OmpA family protein [Afifella sp. H1R]MCF1502459.1 OmpA family protein [Afifella sp. H1R]
MRGHAEPQLVEDQEDESAFVTMTDMTVSILFILLILLAFFASQLRPKIDEAKVLAEKDRQIEVLLKENAALNRDLGKLQAAKRDKLEQYNAEVAEVRRRLLTVLQTRIDTEFPELRVRLSPSEDALQFVGEGLFVGGQSDLANDKSAKVRRIAEIIDAVLPCYTIGAQSAFSESCNAGRAVIESLQIEGHADSDGSRSLNVNLGAARALTTYNVMTGHIPRLIDHQNLEHQPVLSVASYGEDRPIAGNTTPEGKSLNRRIDLRFIMVRPARVDDIAKIDAALRGGGNSP